MPHLFFNLTFIDQESPTEFSESFLQGSLEGRPGVNQHRHMQTPQDPDESRNQTQDKGKVLITKIKRT